jgi:hypothetical protein
MQNVVMGIPCHRRLDILKVQADYHKNVLCPRLLEHNVNLVFFMVGTDHLEEEVLPIDNEVFFYEKQISNVLSTKFNRLVEFSMDRNADALMTMGSDDLIPPNLFLDMLNIASNNKFIAAPSQMLIYDIRSRNTYTWKGYDAYAPHRLLGLGSGRVYTNLLLKNLPIEPFGSNIKSGLESSIEPRIQKVVFDLGFDLAKLSTSSKHPYNNRLLSLKSSNALNRIDVFTSRKLVEDDTIDINDRDIFDWLPNHILKQIVELN